MVACITQAGGKDTIVKIMSTAKRETSKDEVQAVISALIGHLATADDLCVHTQEDVAAICNSTYWPKSQQVSDREQCGVLHSRRAL